MSDTPTMPARVLDIIGRHRDAVIDAMRRELALPGVGHARYMRYQMGWEDAEGRAIDATGGKMLRPAFLLLCTEAAGGDANRAISAAAAIELLHNFTLIHDDIEDQSDTRHGRPALWRVAGIAQAINAGDGLFAVARRALLRLADEGVPPERVLHAAQLLDETCIELCEGQYADLGFEARDRVSRPEYEAMIAGKTAALLGAAGAIGAISAGADSASVAAFDRCGRALGMAFQVRDDVLGIWGAAEATGKPVGDDVRSRKKSFPIVHAMDTLDAERRDELLAIYAMKTLDDAAVASAIALLEAAGAREAAAEAAQRYTGDAIAAVARVEMNGERRRDIEALADFAVRRDA